MERPPDNADCGLCPVYDAMTVFFAWERLRLLYNLILAALVVGFAVWSGHGGLLFWWWVGLNALLVNVCFCLGPVAESYLCWFGYAREPMRWILFVSGTLLTAMSALDAMRGWDDSWGLGGWS